MTQAKKIVTPQVPALAGMTPLGIKPNKQTPEEKEQSRISFYWGRKELSNGAFIMAAKASSVKGWLKVLCLRENKELVVWSMEEKSQELQSGAYFESVVDAVEFFKEAR